MVYRTPFPWYIEPPTHAISTLSNTIGMEFAKPWVRGSKYHRVRYTMGRGLDKPWVWVSTYHGRVFDIPWVGGSIYHGKGVRYTMSRRFGMP
jgi:hypothetical protein